MAIYLGYEGIKGNVTAKDCSNHIEVLSVNFEVTRGVSMAPGNLFNRETSHPNISRVTIIKAVDSSCSTLFNESVSGSSGKKVVIKFVRTGAEKVEEFLEHTWKIVLSAVMRFLPMPKGSRRRSFV